MNPKKIIGFLLIVMGFAFRAISLAYFHQKSKGLPDLDSARRRFERSKRNALLIDAGFVLLGIYVILV